MKGIIIIDHGSKYESANQALFDIVNLFKVQCPGHFVLGAHMELANPSIEDAFNECVSHGVKHIVAQAEDEE